MPLNSKSVNNVQVTGVNTVRGDENPRMENNLMDDENEKTLDEIMTM